MPDRADIYLICGATGAGKSTHAEVLAQRVSGLRFSIDEWMQRLHNPDKPETGLFEWLYPRVERNWAQMRSVIFLPVGLQRTAIRWRSTLSMCLLTPAGSACKSAT